MSLAPIDPEDRKDLRIALLVFVSAFVYLIFVNWRY